MIRSQPTSRRISDIPETVRLISDSVAIGIDAKVALTLVGVTAVPCVRALRPFLSSIVITPPYVSSQHLASITHAMLPCTIPRAFPSFWRRGLWTILIPRLMSVVCFLQGFETVLLMRRQRLAFQLKNFCNRSNFCHPSGLYLPRVKKIRIIIT